MRFNLQYYLFMKTKFILFVAACLMLAASCEKNQGNGDGDKELAAPALEIKETTPTSFKVIWSAVEGAEKYDYEFNGQAESVDKTELEFTGLETDKTYTLKVRSVSESQSLVSDWAEISVELKSGETPASVEFNLSVTSEGLNVIVKTAPSDKTFPYYVEPIPASMYEAAGNDPEAFFSQMMSDYAVAFGSASAAYDKICKTGDQDLKYDISKYAEEKYYVLLAGIDESLNITTEVECVSVDIELPVSDNTFDVAIVELEQTKIVVQVTPSNDDQFAIILQDKKTLDSMTEAQMRNFIANLVNDNNLCSGRTVMQYDKNIAPSHDFSILVFGWDGTFTTEIVRKDFRTPDPEEVDELTFEFNVDVTGPVTANCEIIPSNQKASYFYDVIAMDKWTTDYKEDPREYIKQMAEEKSWTIVRYLTLFGSVGTQEYEYGDSYLSPGSEFVLFAIGYTIEGDEVTYLAPQHVTFSTPAE